MIIYIAGPMTGLPDHNYPAFFAAEDFPNRAGITTANPATLLRLPLGGLRSVPSGVSGIDPRRLAQFAPAAKVAWDHCVGITQWWETGDRGSDETRKWALRIGDDLVGMIMGIRLPEEQREADLLPAATLADWSEVLR